MRSFIRSDERQRGRERSMFEIVSASQPDAIKELQMTVGTNRINILTLKSLFLYNTVCSEWNKAVMTILIC